MNSPAPSSNPSSIFVTGGTGFIGSRLVSLLHARGYRLTLLVRQPSPVPIAGRPPLPAGAKVLHGDLTKPDSWMDALAGHDALIHLAADYRVGLPPSRRERARMYLLNVEASLHLMDAAWQAGIANLIHVSSTAALGETHGLFPDEHARHNGLFRSYYEETKHIAHRCLEDRQMAGIPLKIAIPGGAFGAGDIGPLTQAFQDFMRGKLPFQPDTRSRFQLCHVERLCDGLIRVLERGQPGRNYLLTGQDYSMPELFALLADLRGASAPKKMPLDRLRPLARGMDLLSHLGLRGPLSVETLRVLDGSTYTYTARRAETELGWNAGDVRADLLDWLKTF